MRGRDRLPPRVSPGGADGIRFDPDDFLEGGDFGDDEDDEVLEGLRGPERSPRGTQTRAERRRMLMTFLARTGRLPQKQERQQAATALSRGN